MNETLQKLLGQLALLEETFNQELTPDQINYHWEISWKLAQLRTLLENEIDGDDRWE